MSRANTGAWLAKVRAQAQKLDASVESDDSAYQIVAPVGKVWACDGIHTLRLNWSARDLPEWKIDAARDTLDRMAHGLEDCRIVDCDQCLIE
jgi:hypothetical protein